jgi:hypothetical protein
MLVPTKSAAGIADFVAFVMFVASVAFVGCDATAAAALAASTALAMSACDASKRVGCDARVARRVVCGGCGELGRVACLTGGGCGGGGCTARAIGAAGGTKGTIAVGLNNGFGAVRPSAHASAPAVRPP